MPEYSYYTKNNSFIILTIIIDKTKKKISANDFTILFTSKGHCMVQSKDDL